MFGNASHTLTLKRVCKEEVPEATGWLCPAGVTAGRGPVRSKDLYLGTASEVSASGVDGAWAQRHLLTGHVNCQQLSGLVHMTARASVGAHPGTPGAGEMTADARGKSGPQASRNPVQTRQPLHHLP